MSTDPCRICGCTDLNLVDGYYYCVECGTQDANVRETVVEKIFADGSYVVADTTKLRSTVLKDEVQMSGEWCKWHAYNFILSGLTDELIAAGAKPTVKIKVLWIWLRYIKKFQKKDEPESRQNAETLFPSEDESPQPSPQPEPEKKSKKRTHEKLKTGEPSSPTTTRTSKKSAKSVFNPIAQPPKKVTAYDLFGTDSEDDEPEETSTSAAGKKIQPLVSYLTRRLANGHSRQSFEGKTGTHFIDLKVYRCEEVDNIQPVNRWRHAIICVKNRTNEDTEAWRHLTNFIMATRKEYRKCTPTFISNYY